MKSVFLSLLAVLMFASASVAAERFVDCGPGFVKASVKSRDGIPTLECKKLWCRDLENGKVMGTDAKMNNGYEKTNNPVQLCDNESNCVECFGKRKWCALMELGEFNPEYGMYTKSGRDENAYRGVLKSNCYEWRASSYNCGSGEIAVIDKDSGSWVCITAGAGSDGRSAIKARAVRRTSVMMPIRK